jgi:hypothetical protein
MQSVRLFIMLIVLLPLILSAGQGAVPDEEETVVIGGGVYRLGVAVSDLDEDKTTELGIKEGAYVLEVIEGSEAECGRPAQAGTV